MARSEIKYTMPGTVAHGHILKDGKAEFASFEIEGSYMGDKRAENYVRSNLDSTFNLENVTHFAKLYKMPVEVFKEHATLIDVVEK